MTGVESQGVEFILRFRDEATTQIGTAEGAYSSLVSAMEKVIQTERTFAEAAIDSITRTAAALKRAGGSSLITPLTIDRDQVGLINQFEQMSMQWFRDIGNLYTKYLMQVRSAVATTGVMRDILVALGEAAKEGSGGMDSFFRAARKFTTMKFDKEGTFGQLLSNVQDIVKVFLEFFDVSGKAVAGADKIADATDGVGKAAKKAKPAILELLEALRKAFTGREAQAATQGVAATAARVEELGNAAQQASFHMLDVRDGIRKAGTEAKDKGGFIEGLMGKLKGLKGSFGDIAMAAQMAVGAAVGGKSAQAYSSLEDIVMRIKIQTGEMNVNTRELTLRVSDLAHKSRVTQETMGAIWETTSKLSGGLFKVSDELRTFLARTSEMYKASPEYVAQIAMKWKEVGKLSEQETMQFMARVGQFTKGSKLSYDQWLSTLDEMSDEFRFMAQSYGMSVKDVMQNVTPAMVAIQRSVQDVYGGTDAVMKAIKATMSQDTQEFQDFNAMIANTGISVQGLREALKSGDAAGFMNILRTAAQGLESLSKVDPQSGATMMSNFSKFLNLLPADIKALAATSEENMAKITADIGDAGKAMSEYEAKWANYSQTFTKRWQDITENMKRIAVVLFPYIDKFILQPLVKLSDLLQWIIEKDFKPFGISLNGLIAIASGVLSAFLGYKFISGIFKAIGVSLGLVAKEGTASAGILSKAWTWALGTITASLKTTQAQAHFTTGSLLGLSKANDAVVASHMRAKAAAADAAASTVASAGLWGRVGGILGKAFQVGFWAWVGWEVGGLLEKMFPSLNKLNHAFTVWLRSNFPKLSEFLNFDGYNEKFDEYCKKLNEIQKEYGDQASDHFMRLMKENQGFGQMSTQQFKEFMEQQKSVATGAKAAPTTAPLASPSKSSSLAVPSAADADPVAQSVYKQDGPVVVDMKSGKTTSPDDDAAIKEIRENYPGYFGDSPLNRPQQTTRDDVRDENTKPEDGELVALLRESNSHLKWIRDYASGIAAQQARIMNPRNTLFTQGV